MKLQLRDQCRATFCQFIHPTQSNTLHTGISLSFQPSHCTSWEVWLSPPFRLNQKLNWAMLYLIISPHILRHCKKSNYGSKQTNKPEQQSFLYHGLSAVFQPGKLPFVWWSFPWGSMLVDLTLFSSPSFLWSQWPLYIALVTCSSSQRGRICCVVSGSMFASYVKLK